ncbi:hypothetical protein C0Q70_02692 [Pomacea canaliculata]|uniref:Transmembrane protein 245 n=1 Tax=Pomacea canaliculata TaxID=400727 RepID=A0A2T7PQN0_POMCA|nr:hypothetical protein C0Q70_02692 [Pomacea canaliculata]
MASPSLEYLNNVWQYVPQGHEKALKQAVYNTVANIFVLLVAGAFIAVYFVFSPFLRPLCWALLCGTFLYPFKRTLTDLLRGWLKGLTSSGTPFIVGLIILPVQVVTTTSGALSNAIYSHLAIIVALFAGILVLQLIYHFGPLHNLANAALAFLTFLNDFVSYFSSLWLWTLILAYIGAVAFFWRPESHRILSILGLPVWLIIVFHIASAAGVLRVPLLIAMVVLLVFGFVAEVNQARKRQDCQRGSPTLATVWTLLGWSIQSTRESTVTEKIGVVKDPASEKDGLGTAKIEEGPLLSASSLSSSTTSVTKPTSLNVSLATTSREDSSKEETTNIAAGSLSHQCFYVLLWAHVLVRLWMHIWLVLIFVLLPLIHIGLRFLVQMSFVKDAWARLCRGAASWLSARQDALAPRSVRGVGKLLMRGDRKMVAVLEKSLDSATSTLMILMLLVGSCIFFVVGFVQVQRESMYIVTATGNIFNNTVNQDISQWLPDGNAMQDTMDSMVGKAYVYGRKFIANQVRELLGQDESTNVTKVEQQVLEVWDQIYEKFFSKNVTANEPSAALPAIRDLWDVWDMVSNGKLLNISSLIAFAQDNVGTFLSVLESVWTVIRSNMSLLVSIFTSALSVVFGGGTAILNFVVSSLIFLTTLFYLLAFSGSQYKPVEFFSRISPTVGAGGGSRAGDFFGQAVEEAVSGVFMASLKMAAFYGLYTWLVHLIFGLDIIFIPSALAAMFAAMPFVGAYWACFPAVIDLWLVQDKGLAAIACFLAHMVPSYIVDTSIYSEIKGSHPFMTGLAIAGGMYCMGLEGAILGPILLCCLVVLINMYSSILNTGTPTQVIDQQKVESQSEGDNDDLLKHAQRSI